MVTLTPRTPSARPKTAKSSASAAGNGRDTASRPTPPNAALCIAGETEWDTGDPTSPYSAVSEVTERNRYKSSSSPDVTCPTWASLPAYVHRDPNRAASTRVTRPHSPIPISTAPPGAHFD